MPIFNHHPLHKAIYQKLSEDVPLTELITGVFDRSPQGQAYPYITVGESSASDWSTLTTSGVEHRIAVHVWSREGGRRQAELIMERVHALLHDGSLTIEGHSLVLMRFLSSGISLESDGWTYQGTMRFRALVESE